jgi:hypothetical protein
MAKPTPKPFRRLLVQLRPELDGMTLTIQFLYILL